MIAVHDIVSQLQGGRIRLLPFKKSRRNEGKKGILVNEAGQTFTYSGAPGPAGIQRGGLQDLCAENRIWPMMLPAPSKLLRAARSL